MEKWRCRQFGPDKQQQWKIELLTELIQICLPNNFIFDLIIHPQHCNDRARCRVWPAGDSHICKVSLDDEVYFWGIFGTKNVFFSCFLLQTWWRWLDHQWVKDLHHKWVNSTEKKLSQASSCISKSFKFNSTRWLTDCCVVVAKTGEHRGGESELKGGESEAGGWIRGAARFQMGWIFGKVPKGGGGSFPIQKSILQNLDL